MSASILAHWKLFRLLGAPKIYMDMGFSELDVDCGLSLKILIAGIMFTSYRHPIHPLQLSNPLFGWLTHSVRKVDAVHVSIVFSVPRALASVLFFCLGVPKHSFYITFWSKNWIHLTAVQTIWPLRMKNLIYLGSLSIFFCHWKYNLKTWLCSLL